MLAVFAIWLQHMQATKLTKDQQIGSNALGSMINYACSASLNLVVIQSDTSN
jgi:hypothetical protein